MQQGRGESSSGSKGPKGTGRLRQRGWRSAGDDLPAEADSRLHDEGVSFKDLCIALQKRRKRSQGREGRNSGSEGFRCSSAGENFGGIDGHP